MGDWARGFCCLFQEPLPRDAVGRAGRNYVYRRQRQENVRFLSSHRLDDSYEGLLVREWLLDLPCFIVSRFQRHHYIVGIGVRNDVMTSTQRPAASMLAAC